MPPRDARARARREALEHRRRRTALLGIAALLVLSTVPVFGHHVVDPVERLLAGTDHVWFVCLVALHALMTPVHFGLHALVAGGAAYAVWDRVRARQALHRVLALVDVRAPEAGSALWHAAERSGLDPREVAVVVGLPTPAFTAGMLRPRVYVAAELPDRLGAAELAAVLAHEAAHVRRRDPLRLSCFRFLAHMLFWVPALRRLSDDVADEAELAADDAASRTMTGARAPLVVASALLAVARWRPAAGGSEPLPRGAAVGASSRPDLFELRVRRLAGEDAAVRTHLTRRSLGGAAAAVVVAWSSGLLMMHPMPAGAAPGASHCEHHGEIALRHLFCARPAAPRAAADCPHAVTSVAAR